MATMEEARRAVIDRIAAIAPEAVGGDVLALASALATLSNSE